MMVNNTSVVATRKGYGWLLMLKTLGARIAVFSIMLGLGSCSLFTHTEVISLPVSIYIFPNEDKFTSGKTQLMEKGVSVNYKSEYVGVYYDADDKNDAMMAMVPLTAGIGFAEYCDGIVKQIHNLYPKLRADDSIVTCRKGELAGQGSARYPYVLRFSGLIEKKLKYYYEISGSRCADGSTSGSVGRGTCSWHGGVISALYRKKYFD